MAIQANLDLGETIIPKAYYKIAKVILASADVDTIEDSDDGNAVLTYVKEYENVAHVYVYSDEEARRRNVIPIKTFAIFFEYDFIALSENVYEQAYEALKNVESLVGCEIIDC